MKKYLILSLFIGLPFLLKAISKVKEIKTTDCTLVNTRATLEEIKP